MFLSEKHNAVVYPNVDAAQVKAQIASASVLNASTVAIPCTVEDMQLARVIGLPAISPIEREYDWPCDPNAFPKGPKAHQKVMAAFMSLHPRCFNFSAMRTGKTMSTAWAAEYLMELGHVNRVLVICTLSNMERVWDRELYRHFLGRRRAVVLYGSRKDRLAKLREDADFYIINHDGIKLGCGKTPRGFQVGDMAQALREREDINAVVVDEATAFKLSSTDRFRSLRAIVEHKPYVWLLTGTPTPNTPTDAWAPRKLLFPAVTESFVSFRDRVMFRASQFKWVPKREAPEIVAKFLQPSIRFAREDCIDIPPIQIEQVECDLSKVQADAYKQMQEELSVTVKSGEKINAVNEAVLRMKLIQIACGAVYGPDKAVHTTDAKPRLDLLMDLLEEADSKVLVFAPLTSVVDLLYREIKRNGFSCEMITGGTSSAARTKIFRAFDSENDPHVIVADPGCVAHGLDLSTASTVIWYGPTDKLEVYQQANARIDGPNQKLKQVAIQIVSTPVERQLYKRLDEKRNLQGLILDMVKQ